MKAFVQTSNGQFPKEMYCAAAYGFKYFGYDVQGFEAGELEDITKDTPVFAGIQEHKKIRQRLGITKELLPSYPEKLKQFLGREIILSDMSQIRERMGRSEKCFVKPTDADTKLFVGGVFKHWSPKYDELADNKTPVLVTDRILNLVLEHRVFIHHGEIVDSRKYNGDFRKQLNYDIIQEAVNVFNGPVGYALDFGLTKEGETLLIEATDATSCGHYGLNPVNFASIVIDRWNEIAYES